MKKYSLANYILSIEPNDSAIKSMFGTISIGGQGEYLGSISVAYRDSLWSTTGYATGGWSHDKNLSRVGTVTVSIHQLAEQVYKFIKLCSIYFTQDYEGFTLTLTSNSGEKICTAVDCLIQQIPSQDFAATAATQNWVWTCGQITFA